MSLTDLASKMERRLVFPINCLPAAQFVEEGIAHICWRAEIKYRASLAFAEKFQPDIVFLFTDVTLLAEGLGAETALYSNRMPAIRRHPVKTVHDLPALRISAALEAERIAEHLRAMALMRQAISNLTLAALVHGPFTVAGQLAGETSLCKSVVTSPEFVQRLVDLAGEAVSLYARRLIDAGADLIWVSDALPSLLGPDSFHRFITPVLQRVFASLPVMTVLHVCGEAQHLITEMATTGAQGLSLDSKVDFLAAEDMVPEELVLIGRRLCSQCHQNYCRTAAALDQAMTCN
ncbi:MAG: hypothetical protein D9V47_02705 [Clostridia bacterium]|nr:MAG: hypothetical protein D9V47_02705 [Clostridia bacterium]